ncbi:branched-chain amino acid ABC transporter permease [Chachezhania sediminis]|uniref:branched-chain amino acid ABC transporter permease n=1 Tax=Chachezhania sediminis TaxID=2599291 RepID=UPI00131DD37D|nr:branched-chain amino acid ABC transporter permease [Chachezhania sediminis]
MAIIVVGLSIGMLIFLLAAGLTLIFGMLQVINFAHGALYMLGAYLAYSVAMLTGSFWLTLVIVPLMLLVLGLVIERVTLRPIYDADHVYQVLITFGVVLVIDEVVRFFWGLSGRQFSPAAFLVGSIDIFGTEVSRYRVFVIVVGAIVMTALLLGIEKSRIGLTVKACSVNPDMAAALGIRVERVRMMVFAAGAGLAGFAGAIAGPMLPIQLQMGNAILLDCFTVIIIGGLGNIRGAIVAAFVVGMSRAVGQQWAAEWVDVFTYSLLVLVLLLKPEGLFSKKERTA